MLGRADLGETIFSTQRRVSRIEEQIADPQREFQYINVTGTTNSTSSSTGSIIIDGGMGIVKDLYVGGNLTASNILYTSQTFTGTTESTSTSTGTVIIYGGLGIGKNLNIGGETIFQSDVTCNNNLNIIGTTESTNALTGSLTVNGGVGIIKNVNIGGTNNSTDTNTGSLIVNGGLGIQKNICSGGSLVVQNTSVSSPEVFGAIGDGLIDDTIALQQCLSSSSNIQFGYNKVYRITSSLTLVSNKTIDMNNSVIITNDGTTINNWLNTNGTFISDVIALRSIWNRFYF
jgi:hypothetical protein